MKEVKEMFWFTGLFSLVMIIPVGAWQLFDFLGFAVKALLWGAYFVLFTVAMVANFLQKRGLRWNDIGVSWGWDLRRAMIGGLTGAAATLAICWLGGEVLGFRSSGNTALEEMILKVISGGGWKGRLFLCWFMVPVAVCEELVFRGVIFNYLKTRRGLVFAVAISSLLFGLVHGAPVRMVYTALYGVAWIFSYKLGGGLAAPVIAHYIHNVSAFYIG
jgi:membrane protease YdiL (CAAX protease family)